MLPPLSTLSLKTLVPTGPKTGGKRKADSDLKTIPIAESSALSMTLDINGCAAVPLPNAGIDTASFVEKVDQGTRDWFYARLQEALLPNVEVPVIKTKKKVDQTKMDKWARGRDLWNGLKPATKTAFFSYFDLQTENGRSNLFVTKNRTERLRFFSNVAFDTVDNEASAALLFYLDDRLKYVKQGDSRMGLSNMYKSWSQTGFGKWAHITPSQGLRAAMALREVLEENGIDTQLSGGSHMIYKPPGGKELPAHTDGPRPATTITLIKAFLDANGRFPTTSEWMQDRGVQSLVHFDGGNVDGYTYAIGPMTPKKLYHCLKAVQDETIKATDEELFPKLKKEKAGDADEDDEDEEIQFDDEGAAAAAAVPTARERFLTGGTGPSFMKWKENIDKFNAVLEENGEGPIGEIPLRPGAGRPRGAFVALWANGFPHGSAPNRARRITTTASLAVVGPNYAARDERVVDRVRALAIIASEHATEEQRAEARMTITGQTEPFYGGKTHLHPEHAGTWFDPEKLGSGAGGFYRSIAPTLEDATVFAEAWEEGNPRYAPSADVWRAYEVAKRVAPPGQSVLRPKFEMPTEQMDEGE